MTQNCLIKGSYGGRGIGILLSVPDEKELMSVLDTVRLNAPVSVTDRLQLAEV